jgi:hypothetical protein
LAVESEYLQVLLVALLTVFSDQSNKLLHFAHLIRVCMVNIHESTSHKATHTSYPSQESCPEMVSRRTMPSDQKFMQFNSSCMRTCQV